MVLEGTIHAIKEKYNKSQLVSGTGEPGPGSKYKYLYNTFSWGKAPVKKDSHLARNIKPLNHIGICKIHTAWWLFSLSSYYWFVSDQFTCPLSVLHATAIIFYGKSSLSRMFSPKISRRVMLLKSFIWNLLNYNS